MNDMQYQQQQQHHHHQHAHKIVHPNNNPAHGLMPLPSDPVAAAPAAAAAAARAEAGLLPGQLVANKWRLIQRIGRGAFGDIFIGCGEDEQFYGKRYAMKLEKLPAPIDLNFSGTAEEIEEQKQKAAAAAAARAVLKLEAIILSKLQKYPFVGRFIEYGRDLNLSVAYLLMSLLGENLLRLRRRRKDGKFTLPTILRFGIQAIRCIQAVHDVGFLHRDIKPSNFVIGSNRGTIHGNMNNPSGVPMPFSPTSAEDALYSPSRIFIIDFGLARAYRDRTTGVVLPSRGHIKGFRGTPRYASVHVHREEDLGRRDDLWSLFYILIEFATGDLPWGSQRDKDEIGKIKEEYMSLKLLRTGETGEIPSCFVPFMKHLYSLKFESKPNYGYLIELLQHKLIKLGYGPCEGDNRSDIHTGLDAPFDWEDVDTRSTMVDEDRSFNNNHQLHPFIQNTNSHGIQLQQPTTPITIQPMNETPEVRLQTNIPTITTVPVSAPVITAPPSIPSILTPLVPIHSSIASTDVVSRPLSIVGESSRIEPPSLVRPSSNQNEPPRSMLQLSTPILHTNSVTHTLPLPTKTPIGVATEPTQLQHATLPTTIPLEPDTNSIQPSPLQPVSISHVASNSSADLVAAAHTVDGGGSLAPSRPISSTTGYLTLPLSQPIPVPDTVILSPRKHNRSASSKKKRQSSSSSNGGVTIAATAGSVTTDAAVAADDAVGMSSKPPRHSITIKIDQPTTTNNNNTTTSTAIATDIPIDTNQIEATATHADDNTPTKILAPMPLAPSTASSSSHVSPPSSTAGAHVAPPVRPSSPVLTTGVVEDVDECMVPNEKVETESRHVATYEQHQHQQPTQSQTSGAFTARFVQGMITEIDDEHEERSRSTPTPKPIVDTIANDDADAPAVAAAPATAAASAGAAAVVDDDDDGIVGDGRTFHPQSSPFGGGIGGSLNDAYILSHMPDASIAAPGPILGPDHLTRTGSMDFGSTFASFVPNGNTNGTIVMGALGGGTQDTSFILAPMNSPPRWPPLASPVATPDYYQRIGEDQLPTSSPLATPNRRIAKYARHQHGEHDDRDQPLQVIGSMLLPDDDGDDTSSSVASARSSHTVTPAAAAALAPTAVSYRHQPIPIAFDMTSSNVNSTHTSPQRTNQQTDMRPSIGDQIGTIQINEPVQTIIHADENAIPASAPVAAPAVSSFVSRSPPLSPRSFRPAPPVLPPPAYSTLQKSFGRFRGRIERSPAKPLSQQQVQALQIQTETISSDINAMNQERPTQ